MLAHGPSVIFSACPSAEACAVRLAGGMPFAWFRMPTRKYSLAAGSPGWRACQGAAFTTIDHAHTLAF